MGVVWGIPYLLIKVAVRDLTPASLVFCRTGLGALLLFPIAVRRGEVGAVVRRWRPLVAYTVVELAIPWGLLSEAEKRLPSSLSGLLVAAVPLVGAAIALGGARRERLSAAQFGGLTVGLAGVVVLAGLDVRGAAWTSVAEVGVVVVGYAAGPAILARRLSDLPTLGVVASSLVLCALVYTPAGIAQLPGRLPGGRILAAVVVLGIVCTAAAFLIFFALIREIGPVRATIVTYVNPVVAVALGVGFLGEHAGWSTLVGAVLILAGSVLATGRYKRRSPTGLDAAASAATSATDPGPGGGQAGAVTPPS